MATGKSITIPLSKKQNDIVEVFAKGIGVKPQAVVAVLFGLSMIEHINRDFIDSAILTLRVARDVITKPKSAARAKAAVAAIDVLLTSHPIAKKL